MYFVACANRLFCISFCEIIIISVLKYDPLLQHKIINIQPYTLYYELCIVCIFYSRPTSTFNLLFRGIKHKFSTAGTKNPLLDTFVSYFQ